MVGGIVTALAARGSHRVMYVLDDVSYTWVRFVIRLRTLSREAGTSLSPHIGVVQESPGLWGDGVLASV